MVRDFSDGDDFDNLPTDYTLKDYMLCCAIEYGLMKEGSPNINLESMIEYINTLEPYYQEIYFGFNKKCGNKLKDPREKIYAALLCYKKNDVVVSLTYTFSSTDNLFNFFMT